MSVLRAKTIDLFRYESLTDTQKMNSALNLDEIRQGAATLKSYPRRLVLELTNSCNLNCIMCGRSNDRFTPTFFDLKLLDGLKEVLTCAEEVTLFGWGEPTIHPRFGEILEYLDNYPVKKYFVTNGTTLDKIRPILFDCRVDIMAVSVDGAKAATNNRIRLNSDLDAIVTGLKAVVEQRARRNVNYPYVNFVTTLMKSNLHELPDMVNLAREVGIEEVKAVYLTSFGGKLAGEVLLDMAAEVAEVFAETEKRGKELGVKIKLPYIQGRDVAGDKFHKDCFTGWRDFFIASDGYIRPCQSTPVKLFHISKYDNFPSAWNSEELRAFRAAVNSPKKMAEECKRCYQSSHANWNRRTSFLQLHDEFAPAWEKAKK
ncbi:MAG: radical SAM protein [Deltaproteobacteria bacterium]|nr:radical SAM protein [Deltaproteobacteria bacterium]